MTPVTDSDLSNVTGQAGVNINADLTMNIGIGTMAWGDSDGVSWYWATAGVNTTGYVGVTGFNITNLRIKARETDHYGIGYGTVYSGSYGTVYLKPISIDVATDSGTGHGVAGTTFVRFGLGSLQITLSALSFNVEMGPTTGLGQVLGDVHLGDIGIFINPSSYVDIYNGRAGGGNGVTLAMHITVDQFNMNYVSWSDADGLPLGNTGTGGVIWMAAGTNSTAGYIGLESLSIGGPITINGTVAIDVITSTLGAYAAHGYSAGTVTVCHISFPSLFNLNVAGPITANVKLGNAFALNTAGCGTLGDIYIAGFNLDIAGNSWVDIWAH
jgi:hypothetical protein